MTDRDRLIELIKNAKAEWEGGTNNLDARIADYLIANGVTVGIAENATTIFDLIDRKSLIKNLNLFAPEHYNALVNTLITKEPTVDVVTRGAYDQIVWEYNVALKQLEEHGIPFGGRADVKAVVHGKWTLHPDGSGTCNRCDTTAKNVWDFDTWQNYCGHCGAKMDGECE